MSDRVAAMMAEIEAKQREVERIVAEEAKKNIVPPLIEVLEEEIEYSTETQRINAVYLAAHNAAVYPNGQPSHEAAARFAATQCRQRMLAHEKSGTAEGHPSHRLEASQYTAQRLEAEHQEALAEQYKRGVEMSSKTSSRVPCLLLRAQLDAAKKDAEWKIQSFKIIDALTQRVAALEARLDAKETVPLGTPVLGSVPDSGEDSCEDSCEGSSSHESTRRTLFPYW